MSSMTLVKRRRRVRDLDESGVPDGAVETLCGGSGVERIDVGGQHGNRIVRLIRAVESVNPEGEQLRHYKDELEQGHCVIDVPVFDEARRNQAVQILRAHWRALRQRLRSVDG